MGTCNLSSRLLRIRLLVWLGRISNRNRREPEALEGNTTWTTGTSCKGHKPRREHFVGRAETPRKGKRESRDHINQGKTYGERYKVDIRQIGRCIVTSHLKGKEGVGVNSRIFS